MSSAAANKPKVHTVIAAATPVHKVCMSASAASARAASRCTSCRSMSACWACSKSATAAANLLSTKASTPPGSFAFSA